jgi:hypothetical protein
MIWDEMRGYLGSPDAPLFYVGALTLIFSRTYNSFAAGALTWAVLIVARHFGFTVSEQYQLTTAIFLGLCFMLERLNKPVK